MCTVIGAKLSVFCIVTVASASWANASSTATSKQTMASATPKTRWHHRWEPDMGEHSTPFRLPTVKATALLQSAAVPARRAALILAAGSSERMGTPKALLPWGNTTLLEYV